MLNQIGRHSGFDLTIKTKGDLYVDEHHTVEDTALALGEALRKALGDKRGIERYGFLLPMDDCNCTVALDFGGRPWLVWNADFKRERIGDVPTEMFFHFFKSLSDAAAMNPPGLDAERRIRCQHPRRRPQPGQLETDHAGDGLRRRWSSRCA